MANQEIKSRDQLSGNVKVVGGDSHKKDFSFLCCVDFPFSSPPKEEEIKAKVTEDEEKPPHLKKGKE